MWERVSGSFAQHSREDAWRVCDTEHASLWHMTSVGAGGWDRWVGQWGYMGGQVKEQVSGTVGEQVAGGKVAGDRWTIGGGGGVGDKWEDR